MGWACDACGHAPHGLNKGRGCLRQEDKQPPCGCTYETDREERRNEIMGAHNAPDRNPDLGANRGREA